MKWLSRFLFGVGIVSLVLLAGYTQFGRDVQEASADVVTSPWPTSATTGTHLMVVSMTVSSTWIAPAGVTAVVVEAWGAGGAARPTTSDGCGGGGGYARSLVSVTPGNAYWIQVGARASAATSTFATTTVVAAPGWSWTNGGLGGSANSSTGDVKYSGDNGSAAVSGRGSSAGDAENGLSTGGGASNGSGFGAAASSNTKVSPGGSACDVGDIETLGLVRLTYSSTTISGFPYIRQRYWETSTANLVTYTIKAPTTTQAGDVIFAFVSTLTSADRGSIFCLDNCTGWEVVFTSSSVFGGKALFKKSATSSVGNDFTASTTNGAISNRKWSFHSLVIANADVDELYFSTSSAVSVTYGTPPALNTGISQKYLVLEGSIVGAAADAPFCIQQAATGTMSLPIKSLGASGKGYVWREKFIEGSSFNPAPFLGDAFCAGSGDKDPFSYTVAIAGLAAAPGGSPTFLQRPQRIINIF